MTRWVIESRIPFLQDSNMATLTMRKCLVKSIVSASSSPWPLRLRILPWTRRHFCVKASSNRTQTTFSVLNRSRWPADIASAAYSTRGLLPGSQRSSSSISNISKSPPASSMGGGGAAAAAVPRAKASSTNVSGVTHLVKAGLPLVLFSILGLWVVSNAYGGKLREMETSQGRVSKSVRQAMLEEEHDAMMERLQKIVKDDSFDNTKRIPRPEEILEERRLARERRNAWHRRWYRYIFSVSDDESETKAGTTGSKK